MRHVVRDPNTEIKCIVAMHTNGFLQTIQSVDRYSKPRKEEHKHMYNKHMYNKHMYNNVNNAQCTNCVDIPGGAF